MAVPLVPISNFGPIKSLGKAGSGAFHAPMVCEFMGADGQKWFGVLKDFTPGCKKTAATLKGYFSIETGNCPDSIAHDLISRNGVVNNLAGYFEEFIRNATGDVDFQMPIVPRWGMVGNNGIPMLLMQRAEGQRVYQFPVDQMMMLTREQFANFVQLCTYLQVMDYLCGQRDRHAGNAMLHFDTKTGKCILMGIDDDACLPCGATTDQGMDADRSRPRPLPQWIDRPMANAILALTPDILAEIMQQNGRDVTRQPFLTEFMLMRERLATLQKHVDTLDQTGRVLETPADWNQKGVMAYQDQDRSIAEFFLTAMFAESPPNGDIDKSVAYRIHQGLLK
jgi:hypothetical protein